MADLTVTMLMEEDVADGWPVQHIFPSHETHQPAMSCGCRPSMLAHYVIDRKAMQTIKVFWHNWRHKLGKARMGGAEGL